MTLILRCELPRVKIARGHGMIRTGHGLTWKIDAMRHVYHETVVTPWSGVPWNMIVIGHGYTMVHGYPGTWIYHGTWISWDMDIPWYMDVMGHGYTMEPYRTLENGGSDTVGH